MDKPEMPDFGQMVPAGGMPMTPILRPLKQPLWDSEIYPAAGLHDLQLFKSHTHFKNGTMKAERDTNLTCSGMLGAPIEFDMFGFSMEWEPGILEVDLNKLYGKGYFKFFFGQNTMWLSCPDTCIPNLNAMCGTGIGEFIFSPSLADSIENLRETEAPADKWNDRSRELERRAENYGQCSLFRPPGDFCALDGQPRRIYSSEAFRVEKSWEGSPLIHQDSKLTVYLTGTLYAHV